MYTYHSCVRAVFAETLFVQRNNNYFWTVRSLFAHESLGVSGNNQGVRRVQGVTARLYFSRICRGAAYKYVPLCLSAVKSVHPASRLSRRSVLLPRGDGESLVS